MKIYAPDFNKTGWTPEDTLDPNKMPKGGSALVTPKSHTPATK